MMKKFFLFNELFKQNIKDDRVTEWIRFSFRLNILSETDKVSLLSPKERQLNEIEANFDFGFDLDFNFYNNPILTSQRLKIGSQVFHSQDYARVGPRKSNFIISYIHDNLTYYGIIKYFIQLDADIYLTINNLKVVGNLYDNTGARTSNALINLRNLGAFDKYFCYCREIDIIFFINSNQIVAKCIANRIDAMNYCLSELIDDPDHS